MAEGVPLNDVVVAGVVVDPVNRQLKSFGRQVISADSNITKI